MQPGVSKPPPMQLSADMTMAVLTRAAVRVATPHARTLRQWRMAASLLLQNAAHSCRQRQVWIFPDSEVFHLG